MSRAWQFVLSEVKLQWRIVAWWALGVAGIVGLTNAFFPSIQASPGFEDLFAELPEALAALFGTVDFTTPVGFLLTETYGFFLPALLLVFAIGRGASSIAGEEEAGTLDLLLAQPISRSATYLLKSAVLMGWIALLGIVSVMPTLLLGPLFELDVPALNLMAVTATMTAMCWFFALLSQAVAASTGRRTWGSAVAAAVAFLTYLVNGLGQAVPWLEHLSPLTPWRWYAPEPALVDASVLPGLLILVAAAAASAAVGVLLFSRRNLAA